MKKRILAMLLVLCMAISLLPMSVYAEVFDGSGTCGDNLSWLFDFIETLTISGSGAMDDYSDTYSAPWYAYDNPITTVVMPDGITSIGDCAFARCGRLTSVDIPDSVTSIGNEAFYLCSSLTSVTIPDSVTSIGAKAFIYCSSLTSVDIPDSVTSIGDGAFVGCERLTSVDIPDSVTSIGEYTFSGCDNLTSVDIPDSVTSISDGAFKHCSRLTEITFSGDAPDILDDAFKGVTALAYYPAGNETWTEAVMQDYGGNITWVPYEAAQALSIITQPASVEAAVGSSACFTVEAEGETLTYQWQYSTNNGKTWTNSPATGNTTNAVSISAAANKNGYQYRCVITDGNGDTVTSDAAMLTITAAAPTITKQPANVSATAGTNAKFTVTATGTSLAYQWQYSKDSGKNWTNSPATGNTTNAVSISAATNKNGYQYRCVITDGNGKTVTSDAAILTVTAAAPTITKQPADASAKVGDTAKFTVTATGTGLTYQWQYSKDSGTTWYTSPAEGNTTSTVSISVAANKNGYQYRCVITDGNGKTVNSDSAKLSVLPAITKQPVGASGKVGATAKFTVTATGSGLKYQWEYSRDNGKTWTNSPAEGNTMATVSISVAANKNGYLYRCVVTDGNGKAVTSNAAKLTVLPAITKQPSDASAKAGDTAKFTVTASGVGLTYQWQYSKDSGKTWTNSPAEGNTTSAVSITMATYKSGYLYRCVITDGNGKTVTSNSAKLAVVK